MKLTIGLLFAAAFSLEFFFIYDSTIERRKSIFLLKAQKIIVVVVDVKICHQENPLEMKQMNGIGTTIYFDVRLLCIQLNLCQCCRIE